MRIETPNNTIKAEPSISNLSCKKMEPLTSLESLRGDSTNIFTYFKRGFLTIWRTVVDFFYSIFSKFFPSKASEPAKKEDVHFVQNTATPSQPKYQILHKGISTNNEIQFRKEGTILYLSKVALPDSKTKEYIKPLLEHMLAKEKATAFAPEYLETAKLLWECDYTTRGTICFDYEGKDEANSFINVIIKTGQEKKESLGPDCQKALENIENSIHPERNLVGSFIDLASTSVIGKSTKVELPLPDLFILMGALSIKSEESWTFAYFNSRSPLFKMK